ncbi:MAG TPA: zinc ribbon domain-containing protein [Pirellulales bacterium]|jgi:DNA-directed RNA polymerase subunit RPC12/RpoP|nr:zinc ribbon domain-containing protein [Pirellulales bacterium]
MPTPAATAELAHTAAPQGHACANCGSPVELGDKFCNVCGAPQPVAEQTQPIAPVTRTVECKNCGAKLTLAADQRSITCPFCDSNMVVESTDEQTGRQPPEFIIGFAITPQQALEKFRAWLRESGMFRPGDLSTAKIEEKLRGVYLPFWSFSMLAQSQWSAQIGEHWYRTETYTTIINGKPVTQTRTVTETEWWSLAGQHHNYYSGYLVSGSKGLPQADAERIKPFRLAALKRYQPYFLAGWLSEEYSVRRDAALPQCQQEFLHWEQRNVENFLPGDTHSQVLVNCDFSDVNSDLILLPVYLLSYRYGDKLYRFLLNGQTGKTTGDKPYSQIRIGVAVAIGLVVAVILWWLASHR